MINTTFFIYLHIRRDTGEVFYVGKGTRTKKKQYERAYVTKKRSRFWSAIVNKAGYDVVLYADFFTEDDALKEECRLIAEHKRKCDGGTLCNMTLGGEGSTGLSASDAKREKLRAALSGDRHPNYGKKLSPEICFKKSASMKASPHNLKGKKLPQWWKDKIAATKHGEQNPMYGRVGILHPNSKPVVNIHSGIFFESVQEAADALGYKMQTLWSMLSGRSPNKTLWRFA